MRQPSRRPTRIVACLLTLASCQIVWAEAPQPAAPAAKPPLAAPGVIPPVGNAPAGGNGPIGQFRVAQLRQGGRVAPRPAIDNGNEDSNFDGVFLPPDRTAKRRLELADQMMAERRYGESVRLLGSLLENAEDFFFKPNPDEPVYHSLKAEASRLVAGLPAEGMESYELQFGTRARGMLKAAATSGNLSEVAEVSRRFFFTQAGHEATYLLARHHMDQGRPLAAVLCLERLRSTPAAAERLEPVLSLSLATCWLRAGNNDKAREVLVALKKYRPSVQVLVGGKPVELFSNNALALAWMQEQVGPTGPAHAIETDQWAMFRGDVGRNAASAGGQPLLNVRWQQRTADDRSVERFIAKSRQDTLSQDVVALPSFHPLAVGDVVLMRTAFALQAVNFQNGKLVWKYPAADDAFEQFLKAGNAQGSSQNVQQLLNGLEQRMWEDATYGTISSDGERVFYIEDLGLAGVSPSVLLTVLPNGQRRASSTYRGANHLAARDLKTQGKLKWVVGGVTGEDEPKLAGAFFLGAPLPLLGHLYCLVETKGQEIRLVVLSATTGAQEWSQQLAVVERPVADDPFRRNGGSSPSYADGVLVCPTAAGAIVAIDLTSRSLLWGYQYPRMQQYPQDRFNAGRLTVYASADRQTNDRWMDGSVTIADGKVLLTPVESDQLYCLNLLDGKELWKQSRGSHLYVACVDQGNVILAGRSSVSAVRLADGAKVWEDVTLPDGALPSGRGFHSGTHYYLPLTTAEVAKIDLKTGQIVDRVKSRTGMIPGNLVSYRGSILSQTVDSLDVYHQVDSLQDQIDQALAKNADDPRALSSLAEVKLSQGKLTEAIDLFRRSYRLQADEHTRDQLVECLLDALAVDFAGVRGSLPELEQLIEDPRHRLKLWRLKAVGLQRAGDVAGALETYLKLADLDGPQTLEAIDDRVTVRRDHWIRSQLQQLREGADSEQRQRMDAAIDARLQAVRASGSVDALRGFLSTFGSLPAARVAREALVARLTSDDLLERNLLLRRDERSADPAVAGATAARLASMLEQAGLFDLAAVYYRRLNEHYADIACGDGKTGKQLADEAAARLPATRRLLTPAAWPTGQVKVQEDKSPRTTERPNIRQPRTVDLEIVGQRNPLFQGVTLSYDIQQHLVGLDGLGQKRFRVSLSEQGGRINRNAYNTPALSCASVNGGLLVLSLGTQLIAVDTLRGEDAPGSRILWNLELNEQFAGSLSNQGLLTRPVLVPWGGTRFVPQDAAGHRLGSVGPVNDDGVYFQRLRDLYCVDPLTGKTVWMRKNVGAGHDLFGDEELLFVAPANEGDTLVLRAATGELLGTRRIVAFDRRVATFGRQVLSWEPRPGGEQVLEMRDPWAEKTLWTFKFAADSKASLVSQEVLGVLQPDGAFVLVRLADGKALVQEKLEPETRLVGIHLLKTNEGYLLVTNTAARNEPNVQVQPIPNLPNSLITGRIYAFERETGRKLWPQPLVVVQQGLALNQPSELPILIMARQMHRLGSPGSRDPKISIMCIDKRTGREVYENDQLPNITAGNYEVSGDPETHSVAVTIAPKLFTLTMTDEPLAPPSDAAPPVDEAK